MDITFKKSFTFSNSETIQDYNKHLNQFKINSDKDMYNDFEIELNIDDYKNRIFRLIDRNKQPECLKIGWYIWWSILGCSSCYRMWFYSLSVKRNHTLVKEINILEV